MHSVEQTIPACPCVLSNGNIGRAVIPVYDDRTTVEDVLAAFSEALEAHRVAHERKFWQRMQRRAIRSGDSWDA